MYPFIIVEFEVKVEFVDHLLQELILFELVVNRRIYLLSPVLVDDHGLLHELPKPLSVNLRIDGRHQLGFVSFDVDFEKGF